MLGAATVLCMTCNAVPVMAVGEEVKHLIIAEVSPESKNAAGEEFVEVFNPNSSEVDVTSWQLQYRSSSHTPEDSGSWSARAVIGCQSVKAGDCSVPVQIVIGAGDTIRLSSYETGGGIVPLVPGMATTGGEVRLVQPGASGAPGIVQDMVGYGPAKAFEGDAPAPAPLAGRSIIRCQDDQGAYIDTDQNAMDFVLSPDPDPQPVEEAGVTLEGSGNDAAPQTDQSTVPVTYPDAEITEVFPDPASPQMDSADEFIELYNPYDNELDLGGYIIKTGTNWSHKYAIPELSVDPYGYIALMSAETHLSLSNTGSGVRLYDPGGRLVFEAPSFGKAKTGDSWVRDQDGRWVWTAKPTPGEPNILDTPVDAAPVKSSTKPAAKAASTPKKASTTKSASASAAVKGLATTAPQPAQVPAAGNQTGMWVMAGAGVLGVGYALFEYRQDIAGFFRRRWRAVANAIRL